MMNENESQSRQARKAHEPEILEPDQEWRTEDSHTYNAGWTGRSFAYAYNNNDGCVAMGISLLLFLICLTSFGLLAAIGFLFFHIVLAITGSVIAARKLLAGGYFNVWQWRVCNWIISFLLVFWLAGS